MKSIYFSTFEDFACEIADKYDAIKEIDEYNDVAVIAKYEEARQIIKELICVGYDIRSIEIHVVDWTGYDAEYVVSLCNNSVWCEPMLKENGYIYEESPIIYVMDNCSSKVIPYCKGKTVYEVAVGEEDCECDCDECECECACGCQDGEKPVTNSKESFFINGKSVDKSEFDKKYEELEEKYLDNIRDMLLSYNEMMEEVNEWKSRLLRW